MKKILSKKQEAGVSAVVGVILMVAITVAIAATVYVYVSDLVDEPEITDDKITIEGKLYGYENKFLVIDNVTYRNVYNGDFTDDYVNIFKYHHVRITLKDKETFYTILSIETLEQ